MIDLHSHILPGLDDGAADVEQAVEMCRLAAADGITLLAATPHYYPGLAPLEAEEVSGLLEGLRGRLAREGIDLELVAGAEVALDPSLPALARAGRLPTLGDQGRYFLLELPPLSPTQGLEALVFELQVNGLTPILSHPERTWPSARDWGWLARLVASGCLVQVTAMSLTGQMGPAARAAARRLLEMGCCHLVASDAHSPDWRPPQLSAARAHLERLLGKADAQRMLEEAPRQVLAGQEPPALVLPRPRRRWFLRG